VDTYQNKKIKKVIRVDFWVV